MALTILPNLHHVLRLYRRVNKDADYGVLNDIARNAANARKIEQYWDDMMCLAGSLALGTIRASVLIRSLLSSDRPPFKVNTGHY